MAMGRSNDGPFFFHAGGREGNDHFVVFCFGETKAECLRAALTGRVLLRPLCRGSPTIEN